MRLSTLDPLRPTERGPTEATRIANATLVFRDRMAPGGLTIEGERIVEVWEGYASPRGALDVGGDLVIPGLIELHTDNLERHIQPRPKVDWPHDAAILAHDGELASCGITTVFDAMRVGSHVDGPSRGFGRYARGLALELLALRAAGALKIRHLLHLRAEVCSDTLIDELDEFRPEDTVHLISLMDHTPGQRQFRDMDKFRDYICGKRGLSQAELEAHVAKQYERRERNGEAHETAAVATAARLGAVLASHDDTTSDQVAISAGLGCRLAEFPTTIEAAEACRAADIAIIMGAPNVIRGASHSGNVAAHELAERDLLDFLSSDYVPSALILAAFRLADQWADIPRAIRTVTEAPAAATGLTDRGRIDEGLAADLVRITRHGDTPVIRAVWCGGARV